MDRMRARRKRRSRARRRNRHRAPDGGAGASDGGGRAIERAVRPLSDGDRGRGRDRPAGIGMKREVRRRTHIDMLRTALPILFLCVSVHAQTNSTLTFNASGTGMTAGAGLSFLVTGTSTLTGFGTAQLLASSTIPTLVGVVTSTPITSSVTMIFSTGDVLSGQLVVPAGYLIPQLGQTTSGAASFTITSGSGAFSNASGYFPNLTDFVHANRQRKRQHSRIGQRNCSPAVRARRRDAVLRRSVRAFRLRRGMGDDYHPGE